MIKITMQDILKKQKALSLMAKINGFDFTIDTEFIRSPMKERHYSWSRKSKRNGKINYVADVLYKAGIKNIFPELRKDKLKEIIRSFVLSELGVLERKRIREELYIKRRYRRLFPLSTEKYTELKNRSPKWGALINTIFRLKQSFCTRERYDDNYLSDITNETLFRLDEGPHKKPKADELKYV